MPTPARTALETPVADSPLGLALRLQSDWFVQLMDLQSAWMSQWSDLQRQAIEQGWLAEPPWLRWMVWHNGTEQLA